MIMQCAASTVTGVRVTVIGAHRHVTIKDQPEYGVIIVMKDALLIQGLHTDLGIDNHMYYQEVWVIQHTGNIRVVDCILGYQSG